MDGKIHQSEIGQGQWRRSTDDYADLAMTDHLDRYHIEFINHIKGFQGRSVWSMPMLQSRGIRVLLSLKIICLFINADPLEAVDSPKDEKPTRWPLILCFRKQFWCTKDSTSLKWEYVARPSNTDWLILFFKFVSVTMVIALPVWYWNSLLWVHVQGACTASSPLNPKHIASYCVCVPHTGDLA